MSVRGKEKKRTGDNSNRVERLEMGGFAGVLSHAGSVLWALGLRPERVPVGNPEKGKISWDRKK
jgi:hypothetical protein